MKCVCCHFLTLGAADDAAAVASVAMSPPRSVSLPEVEGRGSGCCSRATQNVEPKTNPEQRYKHTGERIQAVGCSCKQIHKQTHNHHVLSKRSTQHEHRTILISFTECGRLLVLQGFISRKVRHSACKHPRYCMHAFFTRSQPRPPGLTLDAAAADAIVAMRLPRSTGGVMLGSPREGRPRAPGI